MLKAIEIIEKTRLHLLELIKPLTIEQLNRIPQGFNNNIVWNVGHIIAAQQGVCYLRAGIDMRIDTSLHTKYKPETRPEAFVTQEEVDVLKQILITTVAQLQTDYTDQIFSSYIPWTTRYGVAIDNIEQAVGFLPFHEGLHLGYIMAQRRALGLVQ